MSISYLIKNLVAKGWRNWWGKRKLFVCVQLVKCKEILCHSLQEERQQHENVRNIALTHTVVNEVLAIWVSLNNGNTNTCLWIKFKAKILSRLVLFRLSIFRDKSFFSHFVVFQNLYHSRGIKVVWDWNGATEMVRKLSRKSIESSNWPFLVLKREILGDCQRLRIKNKDFGLIFKSGKLISFVKLKIQD